MEHREWAGVAICLCGYLAGIHPPPTFARVYFVVMRLACHEPWNQSQLHAKHAKNLATKKKAGPKEIMELADTLFITNSLCSKDLTGSCFLRYNKFIAKF